MSTDLFFVYWSYTTEETEIVKISTCLTNIMIVSEVEMDNNCAQYLFFKLFAFIDYLLPWKAFETALLTVPEFSGAEPFFT